MNILVDTSVWSLVLRRRPAVLNPHEIAAAAELRELLEEGRAKIIGSIRQEVLSGIRERPQFEKLRDLLRVFPDEPVDTNDYERAAAISNDCRAAGLAGSPVDFLICAIAVGRKWPILTRDGDFQRYARVLPLQLHEARKRLR